MAQEFIDEVYNPASLRTGFRLKKRLFSGQSAFQKVEVIETEGHGRMLFNDGCAMTSERDERIYHEMLVHVPMQAHAHARRVLIIGGGDGGTAREVLRYGSVESVTMVEIDELVVRVSKEWLKQTSAALEDPRLKLIIGDGVEFVRSSSESFDVILVDSTDPVGPAAPLFGVEFYSDVKRRLRHGGVVVAQGETPFYAPEAQASLARVMGHHFQIVRPYNFTNMTYPGGLWSFMWASDEVRPVSGLGSPIAFAGGFSELFYYNREIHVGSFSLPNFMQRALDVWMKGEL